MRTFLALAAIIDSDNLKQRVRARARSLGTSIRALLAEAALGHDLLDQNPPQGHRLETLRRLAAACGWSLPELLGVNIRIDLGLARQTFASARKVQRRLPRDVQSDPLLVEIFAYIYDALIELRCQNEPIDAATLKHYEQILVRTWLTWAMDTEDIRK